MTVLQPVRKANTRAKARRKAREVICELFHFVYAPMLAQVRNHPVPHELGKGKP